MKQLKRKIFHGMPVISRTFFVLLIFIAADEVSNNTILESISSLSIQGRNSVSVIISLSLTAFFLILQVFAAPFQAGISDFSCRKKSLVFSMAATLISVMFLWCGQSIIILIMMICLKALMGNTLPIAWAGIIDEQSFDKRSHAEHDPHKIRKSLAISIVIIGWGYLLFKMI